MKKDQEKPGLFSDSSHLGKEGLRRGEASPSH